MQDDQKHWQIVFLLAGGGYFFGNLVYVIFASGEVQDWNDVSTRTAQNMIDIEREANSSNNRRNRGTKNIKLTFK